MGSRPVSDALDLETEALYRVFAGYDAEGHSAGCPHCVSDADHRRLYRLPLRELLPEDLERYAFKAMTTWGDVDGFRHFLPRLFELQASATPLGIDSEILFGKLNYGGWRSWPLIEQQAIEAWLWAWGDRLLSEYPSHPALTEFISVFGLVIGELGSWLIHWQQDERVPALRHLAELASELAQNPKAFRGAWWDQMAPAITRLEVWLGAPETESRLEAAYWRYQSEPFAAELAAAADWLLRTRPQA